MTTLYVPLHLPTHQAEAFLNRELRYREVESVKVRGNLMVIEHHPRSILEMTDQDWVDYYGITDTTIIV